MRNDNLSPNARAIAGLVVPTRYAGPPGAANGGWLAGHLASMLAPSDTVEVSLRAVTPVERRLEVLRHGPSLVLAQGEDVLATATIRPGFEPDPPAPVDEVTAEVAGFGFAGFESHPFPDCFVCGHHRSAADGLRLFTGPVEHAPGTVAGVWVPPGSGEVRPELVWAALDCPTGWAHATSGGVALLGRIAVRRFAPVVGGRTYVVVGRAGGRNGRKLPASGAIYTTHGELVAASETVWIDVTVTLGGAPTTVHTGSTDPVGAAR